MKTRSRVTDPLVAAVVLYDSAVPAGLESTAVSVAAFPSRTASPGGGGGGGVVESVPATQAESAPSEKDGPLDQVAGSAVRFAAELFSELPAPTALRSRNRIVPAVPSSATQYVCPAVTAADGTLTKLNCPVTGAEMTPEVRSAPGWFVAELAYSPTA